MRRGLRVLQAADTLLDLQTLMLCSPACHSSCAKKLYVGPQKLGSWSSHGAEAASLEFASTSAVPLHVSHIEAPCIGG